QLLPARFMSQPREAGYGDFLLHDVRRDADGNPDPSFPLNAQPGASVLVTGSVFGSGSSR
ncbi:MAG: 3-isopropylmalate dehydratase small subunit, partial [Pseudomonadota bacterium]